MCGIAPSVQPSIREFVNNTINDVGIVSLGRCVLRVNRTRRINARISRAVSLPTSLANEYENLPDDVLYEIDNLHAPRGMNSKTVNLIANDHPFNTERNRAGSTGCYVDRRMWATRAVCPRLALPGCVEARLPRHLSLT